MNILTEETLSILPEDLVVKARFMSKAYEYLYCIENILRIFIDEHQEKNKMQIPASVQKAINERKTEEAKHKWIALRGSSDLYYMDFKDLKSLIVNNYDLFKNDFPSEYWISAKIEDLARCRNLIAHNSFLDKHELDLIKANFNSIVRQLQLATGKTSDKKDAKPDPREFVRGLNKSKVFTKSEVEAGIEYALEFPPDLSVAPFKLKSFFHQVAICIQFCFDRASVELFPPFNMGKHSQEEGPVFLEDSVIFQIGQYDIDDDGIDEIFICLLDTNEKNFSFDSVQVLVYKYFPPAFGTHAFRRENWELIGNFSTGMIMKRPEVIITERSITIPRFHRGFYYEWTFVRGIFRETGSY
jgi:hypothetical protein